MYAGCLKIAEMTCGINVQHEAGYICSMLFIIPGFPFITSGIDMAKLDMRSGLERLSYAVMIVLIATMAAWLMALALHLKPVDFLPLNLSMLQYRIPPARQLLRCVRLFNHVQQPGTTGDVRRGYRRNIQHAASGAG